MYEALGLIPSIALKMAVVAFVIAVLRRWKQEHQKFTLVLGYLTILRSVWGTEDCVPEENRTYL